MRKANKRRQQRRKARTVLVIKEPWLTMILERRKVWEIRCSNTHKRGWIQIARSGAGGEMHGSAKLVGVRPLSVSDFPMCVKKHCVQHVGIVD